MAHEKERYSPEEAAEEASEMQKKVKSGEAPSYDQAELMVEREKSKLSIEGIRNYTQELKAKIGATKRERESNIQEKIQDRETLIKEARTTYELLGAAQEALDYYTTIQDLGELKDPKDVAKLKELKKLVSSITTQSQDIDNRIERISSQPEIMGRLRDNADAMDLERRLKTTLEEGKAELLPQIEQVFEKIKTLAVTREFVDEQWEINERELTAAKQALYEVFYQVEAVLRKQYKGELLSELDEARKNIPQASALYQRIVVVRQGLGMFKGKEKAALDRLIVAKGKFDELDEKEKTATNIQDSFKRFKSDLAGIAQLYRHIILKSWDIDEQLQEKEPFVTQHLSLVYNLRHQLEERVDAFALEKLRGDRGRIVPEKYSNNSSLNKARSHPDNKFLDLTFSDVYRDAGGQNLHYIPPTERN